MRASGTLYAGVGLSRFWLVGAPVMAAVALAGREARAASYSLEATDVGWYRSSEHSPSGNYIVGNFGSVYHDYFIFTLAALAPNEQVTAASLTLYTHEVSTPHASETVTFFDVTTPKATLLAGGGSSAWTDLGSGTAYGSQAYTMLDSQTTKTITLNAAARTNIKNAAGGTFAIGGAVTTLDNTDDTGEWIYGFSHAGTVQRLDITTTIVPEPGAVGIVGMGSLSLVRRRRMR
jgi:hypothetical protein